MSDINLENFSLDNYIKDQKKKKGPRGAPKAGVRRTGRPAGKRTQRGQNTRDRAPGPRRLEREHRDREPARVSSRRRLRVSNLPFNVTNQEIYELFSQFGPLSICKIQYDKLGSQGTATVEFNEESAARQAIKEYNGAELDGKSISIQYASSAGGSTLAHRIGKERDERRDRGSYRREGNRPAPRGRGSQRSSNRGDRSYNKRRFNDRVRNQRSYRDRR